MKKTYFRKAGAGSCFLFAALLMLLVFLPVLTAQAKSKDPMTVSFKTVNTWKQGKDTYVQMNLTLKNTQKTKITNWNLTLTMDQKVTLVEGWNAVYSVKNKTMTVKPVSYNKVIEGGGTREIGFIVRASRKANCKVMKGTVWNGSKKTTIQRNVGHAVSPTPTPSPKPTRIPTPKPTRVPTPKPTRIPTPKPTRIPTPKPTRVPTPKPTRIPTPKPTRVPTPKPTRIPTPKPTTAPAHTQTPLQKNGRLSVLGTRLVNQKGKTVVLKGVSTHGINWFPQYVNKAAFKELRDQWGVTCIRLAMYTEEHNGYCSGGDKAALKKKIQEGVKYASDLGLYVIIDWHILSDGDPRKNQTEAVAFFKEMSKKYKNQKNVIYEICNEPNGGTDWKTIKSYAGTVIKTIRANDKNAVILVGTPTWSQDVDAAAKDPIKGYKNIMYTFHFYAATHGQSYRNKVQTAIWKGLPVFVSEFGICEASGNGKVDKTEGDKWISFLKKNSISFVCWNLSNKAEKSALIKNSCTKTSGFAWDDLTTQGQWYKKVK